MAKRSKANKTAKTPPPEPPAADPVDAPRVLGRGRKLAFGCLAALLGLALLEGLASLAVFGYDAAVTAERPLAERYHTAHDDELGWVNIPDTQLPDFYAPGRGVTIGPQGFRGGADVSPTQPEGTVRLVCSGDSFTFGYGVDDDETWCRALERAMPTLRTVNMGQGGYGLDQAYLWYLRDGAGLEHDVHVLAVIANDIARMTSDEFLGFKKPYLTRSGGVPGVAGTPVPDDGHTSPWATQNVALLRQLGLVELGARAFGAAEPGAPPERVMSLEEAVNVARDAVLHLNALADENGRRFVLAFLPARIDLAQNSTDFMREPFLAALRADGVTVVDLVTDIRQRPPADPAGFFIAEGEVAFPAAAGHYTAAGNQEIAARLLEHLRTDDQLARLLSGAD